MAMCLQNSGELDHGSSKISQFSDEYAEIDDSGRRRLAATQPSHAINIA